jgi:uncharacterized integral membrane protein
MNDRDEVDRHAAAVHRRDMARLIRLVVIAVIVAALIAVAMDNRDDVRVGYAVGDTEAPVWIVVVVATVCGVFIGWLSRHRPRQR